MNPTERNYSKMNAIMASLGCDGQNGLYGCEDLNVDFDLTATADDNILLTVGQKMFNIGYEACKTEFRDFMGV